jgi:hypothetical protein
MAEAWRGRSGAADQQNRLGFEVFHPFRKEREKDGAPAVLIDGVVNKGSELARCAG